MCPDSMIAEKNRPPCRDPSGQLSMHRLLDGYGVKDIELGGPTGRPGGGGEAKERSKDEKDGQAGVGNCDIGDALLLE